MDAIRDMLRHRVLSRGAGGSLDRYVTSLPCAQNAIDAVPGWHGAMPAHTGLRAGLAPAFADPRIAWLLSTCFPVGGRNVLELGPLEGFHTYMLHQAGAASIESVEANTLAYMRCLVTKEVLGLARARFLLGDFMPHLEMQETRYDLILASGVLYHSPDPVRLLELIGRRADALYLWTHYYDGTHMPKGDARLWPFSGRVEEKRCAGLSLRLHERSYKRSWRNPKFCGGTHDRHYWMERAGILALLEAFGFARIVIADDEPGHVYGPSFSVFASR